MGEPSGLASAIWLFCSVVSLITFHWPKKKSYRVWSTFKLSRNINIGMHVSISVHVSAVAYNECTLYYLVKKKKYVYH